MNRCQEAVLAVRAPEAAARFLAAGSVLDAIPERLSIAEALIVKGLLLLIAKELFDQSTPIDSDRVHTQALLRLAVVTPDASQLRTAFELYLDDTAPTDSVAPLPPTVAHALWLLGLQYSNHALSLPQIAEQVHLSTFHLSRLIKRSTGMGFKKHLHNARITAAARLLCRTTRSIKEIAFDVGYRRASELDSHFKALYV